MDENEAATWSTEGIRDSVFEVLLALGVTEVEMEVSRVYLEPLIELADQGEVMPIDRRDPAGGFGGVDLLIATVVPAMAAALGLRRSGNLSDAELAGALDRVIDRVHSPRAQKARSELDRILRTLMK